jgi:hypothetical protein
VKINERGIIMKAKNLESLIKICNNSNLTVSLMQIYNKGNFVWFADLFSNVDGIKLISTTMDSHSNPYKALKATMTEVKGLTING